VANSQEILLAGNLKIPNNGGTLKVNTSTLTLNGTAGQIVNTLGYGPGQIYGVIVDSNTSAGV